MKIKQLHIRNIASIESGDIDFENGLRDAATGLNAPMFLIGGDTGAGKTVILDCISMALYRTTPRQGGNNEQRNNDYDDAEGEKMVVNSMKQYTRLGISDKEECYSEVVLTGNDGEEYTARYTLGMNRPRQGENKGKLVHRDPVWQVRRGAEAWLTGVRDCEELIRRAVGLTFEQFGRMAMLAQGQFATFLVGKKEEREEVLEQLTNTQKFSAYGQAIADIYARANKAKTLKEKEYEDEKKHILADDERERLEAQQQALAAEKKRIEGEIAANAAAAECVREINRCDKAEAEAVAALAELDSEERTAQVEAAKTLVARWGAAEPQRKALTRLADARRIKTRAESAATDAREKFTGLNADFMQRQIDLTTLREALCAEQRWLDDRADLAPALAASEAADVRLAQYAGERGELARLAEKSSDQAALSSQLKAEAARRCAEAETARGAVAAKQSEIDALQGQRDALDIAGVNDRHDRATRRKTALTTLAQSLGQLERQRRETDLLAQGVERQQTALPPLKEAMEGAESAATQARRRDDEAASRLNTMKMSLDEKLVNLRRSLAEGHADACPLCGQSLAGAHLEADFRALLTPLQQEQTRARAERDRADGEARTARTAYDTAASALKKDASRLAAQRDADLSEARRADKAAAALGLDVSAPLRPQAETALQAAEGEIAALRTTQRRAEELQTQINRLTNEKKPLDRALQQAERGVTEAEKRVDENASQIASLAQQKARLEQSVAQTGELLAASLAPLAASPLSAVTDRWADDAEATRAALRSEAQEYSSRVAARDAAQRRLDAATAEIQTVPSTRSAILALHPDWPLEAQPRLYPCRDILSEWADLLSAVRTADERAREADDTAAECQRLIDRYCADHAVTAEELAALAADQAGVTAAQTLIARTDADRRTYARNRDEAKSLRLRAVERLGLPEIPDLDTLLQQGQALSAQRDEALKQSSANDSRLDDDRRNQENFRRISAELQALTDTHDRWYRLNNRFGGNRFRTLVQSHILRPLLQNANRYLERITDQYRLTCSDQNEQLSILVLDRYNKDQVRAVTVLSGGERFMISLALSLALSTLNRPEFNVDILFIDEGFGTLDGHSLESVMNTLDRLPELTGGANRRVGVISHRKELEERIPVQIQVRRHGEGRSRIEITNSAQQ